MTKNNLNNFKKINYLYEIINFVPNKFYKIF